MSSNTKRLIGALTFFVWMATAIAAFYVVQKPTMLAALPGLWDTIWSISLTVLLIANACCLGLELSRYLKPTDFNSGITVIISTGLGLGFFGIAGLVIAALGMPHPLIFGGIQFGLIVLFWWRKTWHLLWKQVQDISIKWNLIASQTPLPIRIVIGLAFSLIFVLALAPPAEAFDALLYHLVWPARILADSGIQPYNISPFWHPALVEGVFIWPQSLGSDRSPQFLHLTWMFLSIALVWYWAYSIWGKNLAQRVLLILLSIPSLYLLSTWAYTDFALTFYGAVALYAVCKANLDTTKSPQTGWIVIAGIAAGMAMGVKYTSFPVPVTCGLLILWWRRKTWQQAFQSALVFSLIALLVASPWYLRNWFVMENPFYPFIWDGLYWDSFRSQLYTAAGTGIGWDPKELLLLPINATLGHHDATYYDGRIGIIYLVLTPLTIYVLLTSRRLPHHKKRTLVAIGLFVALSLAAWVFGVINSSALWQTRLLFPMLIPLTLPTALGWLALKKLDTKTLRVSFIFNVIVAVVIVTTIIDAGLMIIQRNPLAYAFGVETREAYLGKVQPAYAQATQLLELTPEDAQVYFLFEPRSYYMPREVQPDAILDNFGHDFHIEESPSQVYTSWIDQGYTHVLIYRRGVDFLVENDSLKFTPEHQEALNSIIEDHLDFVGATDEGAYELYEIIR